MLSNDEKAKILAEEEFRAQARAQFTSQPMITHNAGVKPGYWGGFFLNCILIGLGHLTIGEVVWGIVWFIAALVIIPMTAFLALPVFWIAVLVHYNSLYRSKYNR